MTIDTKRLRELAEEAESEGGRVTLSPSIIHLVAIEIDRLRGAIRRLVDATPKPLELPGQEIDAECDECDHENAASRPQLSGLLARSVLLSDLDRADSPGAVLGSGASVVVLAHGASSLAAAETRTTADHSGERDQLAAVVEKVRVRLTTDLDEYDESHVSDALTILDSAPQDVLREHDAALIEGLANEILVETDSDAPDDFLRGFDAGADAVYAALREMVRQRREEQS